MKLSKTLTFATMLALSARQRGVPAARDFQERPTISRQKGAVSESALSATPRTGR